MKNLKIISDNDLSELIDLTSHLANEIESYKHVSDFMPPKIENSILDFNTKLIDELNRRETENIA